MNAIEHTSVAPGRAIRTAEAGRIRTYGPFVLVMFLLATTRWGSYAIPGPPYISDLVIAFLLADRLLALPLPGHVLARNDYWLSMTVGALLVVSLFSFLTGPMTPNSIRDVAPFAYGVTVFITAPLLGRKAELAGRMLALGLFVHLAWTTLALAIPSIASLYVTPGNSAVHILSLRSDMDGLVNGLAAGIGLFRVTTGRKGILMFIWGAVLVLVSHSRISLIATVLLLVIVAGYAVAQGRRGWWMGNSFQRLSAITKRTRNRSLWTIAGALILIGVVVSVTSPTAVSRLAETFGFQHATHEQIHEVEGTTHSREVAWSRLENWITESERRTFIGSGFGPNIMTESNATVALVHRDDPDLRAPNKFFLGVWAHLGLLGLALMVVIVLIGLRLAFAVRQVSMSDVDLLAALLAVGIPMIAGVGVVMESPFGAIPFFWALGQLGSHLAVVAPVPRQGTDLNRSTNRHA
jgi:hypothetical protein